MEIIFYFSAIIAILATLRVITHTHPIYALFYFIISLLAVSCVFFSLGDNFIGALEIIIYSGAISVLFIFVIMMLNVNVSVIHNKKVNNIWTYYYIYRKNFYISVVLLKIMINALLNLNNYNIINNFITDKSVGILLFGQYALCIELASLLLLSGLVVSLHLGREIN